jgi:Leucine-rich repeat (LRR) protein
MIHIRFHAEALPRLVATSLCLLLVALASLANAQETEPVQVTIPDPHFEALIRSTLNQPDGPLLNTSLATITSLTSDGIPIASLEGIQHCTGLKTLSIRHAEIRDISPITGLTQLESINLAYNYIRKIPSFSLFTSLKELNLSSNRIYGDPDFKDLPSLRTLDLSSNELKGLYSWSAIILSHLPSLISLSLSGNPELRNVHLKELRNLVYLNIAACDIRQCNYLSSELPNLQYMNMSNNPIYYTTELPARLPALRILELQGCKLSSIDTLRDLPSLTSLNIADNFIESPESHNPIPMSLESLTSLVHLNASRNKIRRLDWVQPLRQLETLDLSHNNVSKLYPLVQLDSLRSVNLSNNQIEAIAAIAGGTNLTWLDASHNKLESVGSLVTLKRLKHLNLDSNELKQVGALGSLEEIEFLSLADNDICRLDALLDNPGIGVGDTLTVHGNPLGAAACQSVLPALDARGAYLPFWQDICPSAVAECPLEEDEYVPQGIVVEFPDPNLQESVRGSLGWSGPLTDTLLLEVTGLYAINEAISNLAGLEYCPALRDLSIRLADGTDTGPIRNLSRLEELSISGSQLEDLGFVSDLTNLEYLSLWRNRITDLTPLSGLARLHTLRLDYNQVSDVSPIAHLPNLKTLGLTYNQVCSVSPLIGAESVPSLKDLYLDGNPLSYTFCEVEKPQLSARKVYLSVALACTHACEEECAPPHGRQINIPDRYLAVALRKQLEITDHALPGDAFYESSLASLCELDISNAGSIRSLEGLQYCSNLKSLRIYYLKNSNYRKVDIRALAELPNLQELTLERCDLPDIAPIASLSKLTKLTLNSSTFSGIENLSALSGTLKELHLYNCGLTDTAPLASLASLTTLNLSENELVELEGIGALSELRALDLSGNDIESIDELFDLTKLESLDLSNLRIKVCECWYGCYEYTYTNNHITRLDAVRSMPNLRHLNLGTKISSYDYIECEGEDFKLHANKSAGEEDVEDFNPNEVSDLSPLSGLLNLESVDLEGNNVCDLGPLLANPGIGSGDGVNLSANPLSAFACSTQVVELRSRGAVVSTTGATCQGECPAPEGEGEGVVVEGEGIVEGSIEGASDGEGLLEGTPEGSPEGGRDGEGTPEGEGQLEGQLEGQPEGVHDGAAEGAPEGGLDGEGVSEGEGVVEGSTEGEGTGDGAIEGEGDGDGAAEGEGQGEGMPLSTPEALLQEYHALDTNDDGVLTTSETGDGEAFRLLDRNGDRQLSVAELRQASGAQAGPVHASDSNGDGTLSLEEVLRGIQFFNAQGLRCAANADSEDGYRAGRGDSACVPHSLDYAPQDWSLSLSEMLRLIQLHNGGYHACETYEDGYCLGEIH